MFCEQGPRFTRARHTLGSRGVFAVVARTVVVIGDAVVGFVVVIGAMVVGLVVVVAGLLQTSKHLLFVTKLFLFPPQPEKLKFLHVSLCTS